MFPFDKYRNGDWRVQFLKVRACGQSETENKTPSQPPSLKRSASEDLEKRTVYHDGSPGVCTRYKSVYYKADRMFGNPSMGPGELIWVLQPSSHIKCKKNSYGISAKGISPQIQCRVIPSTQELKLHFRSIVGIDFASIEAPGSSHMRLANFGGFETTKNGHFPVPVWGFREILVWILFTSLESERRPTNYTNIWRQGVL